MRARGWRRIALAAALLAAAACGDFLAAPAAEPAPLALSIHPSGRVMASALDSLFDQVDAVYARITRGQAVVAEGAFAVTPSGGEIRRTFEVMLDSDPEDLGLVVQLRRQGEAVFAADTTVRLWRGRKTVAEIAVTPVP